MKQVKISIYETKKSNFGICIYAVWDCRVSYSNHLIDMLMHKSLTNLKDRYIKNVKFKKSTTHLNEFLYVGLHKTPWTLQFTKKPVILVWLDVWKFWKLTKRENFEGVTWKNPPTNTHQIEFNDSMQFFFYCRVTKI